ncbi:hypothetical protein ACH5RR_039858 [Cinchona calisaya]|uniref:F-box protein At3g26010-like beta-propeller domain-containing protein n=1 Tax=Cinchona calisaya TaxID=153742 RepID=A0ABD2Y211_9GENT
MCLQNLASQPFRSFLPGGLYLLSEGKGISGAAPATTWILQLHVESGQHRVGSFVSISNGLVLRGDYPNFHVFNPVTRQLFTLPPSPFHIESVKDSFARSIYKAATPGFVSCECDNDFKVIVPIVDERDGYGQKFMLFWMYFSETGLWKELVLVAPDCLQVFPGVLCTSIGGTVFWYASAAGGGCHFLAYDPDSGEGRVQLISLPKVRCITDRHPTLCQSTEGFRQCAMDTHELPGFRVYTLANKLATHGYDDVVSSKEWILIYDVRLDMLDAMWTGWLQRRRHRQHDMYVVRMAYHPLNLIILFFRMGHGIYCCDVENGEIDLIPYEGRHFYANDYFMLRPYVQPHWSPSPLPKGV